MYGGSTSIRHGMLGHWWRVRCHIGRTRMESWIGMVPRNMWTLHGRCCGMPRERHEYFLVGRVGLRVADRWSYFCA